ncbi:MAG TPA: DUF6541 family protein, partial [Dermatophilaceae bacterium]|nr:DUF6541 family protein [Dermatophilaceae bacterium]
MIPGSTSWADAVPTILLAAALLFVPGAVVARAIGARAITSLSVAPAVSTTVLTGTAVVAAALGIPWGVAPLAAGVVGAWIGAVLVGHVLRRRGWSTRRGENEAGSGARAPRLVGWATAGGVAFAVVVVAAVLVPLSGTPDHFPQHPDTIFHLGTAQWMLEHRDASVLHADGFVSGEGSSTYPAAFHVVTSTTALLGGTNVVVATSACVLVMAAVVWPLGMMLLGRALLGSRLEVAATTGVTSVLFTAFPFALMGYGVLWPNLFGQSLLPSTLALAMAAVVRLAPHRDPVLQSVPAALLLLASLPGLTLAHTNALVSLLVFGYLIVALAIVRRAWMARARPAHASMLVVALAIATMAGALVATALRPEAMVRSRPLGPEQGIRAALIDTVFFAPRQGVPLILLSVVVALGAAALVRRHRGAGWVVAGLALYGGLFFLNIAVDTPSVRYLTWPWYNDPVRLAAISVLPAALCASAGLLVLGALAAHPLAGRRWAPVATTGVVLAALVLGTQAYVGPHRGFIDGYFAPSPARSWASDEELLALNRLARHIPPGAVTAANPWNGATYLYVTSGRRLLVPTEKSLTPGDRTLLAAQLDRAGTSPDVCDAARRQRVEYAITGGKPFSSAGAGRLANYRGI